MLLQRQFLLHFDTVQTILNTICKKKIIFCYRTPTGVTYMRYITQVPFMSFQQVTYAIYAMTYIGDTWPQHSICIYIVSLGWLNWNSTKSFKSPVICSVIYYGWFRPCWSNPYINISSWLGSTPVPTDLICMLQLHSAAPFTNMV